MDLVVDQVAVLVVLGGGTIFNDKHAVGGGAHNFVFDPHAGACEGIVHAEGGEERQVVAVGCVG